VHSDLAETSCRYVNNDLYKERVILNGSRRFVPTKEYRRDVWEGSYLYIKSYTSAPDHTADALTEPDIDNYGTFVLVSISHTGVGYSLAPTVLTALPSASIVSNHLSVLNH
jgi:hypothetical protein